MSGHLDAYSDDAPRINPEKDDALGIAPFANRMAELIVALEAPNGYVIGLSGEWGSGKTSTLNFVKHYIEQIAPPRLGETAAITIIDFKPWLVSGHEDLIGSFFKVLAEQLGQEVPRWKGIAADTAKLGADLSGALSKIGLLTAHADLGAVSGASIAMKRGFTKAADRWAAQPSLQKTHVELQDVLRYSATKIIVVIDDLDRLQPGEIQAMLMMVKTVGHLPNVVYLLSYDRNVIWPALQQASPAITRANFAEKLVQQEVALPHPGIERLLSRLLEEAAFLAIDVSDRRWDALVQVALRRWLRTPRDIVRLVNNLRFAWPVLRDHMNGIEYLAIEGVRTFDRTLFDWIRDNPALLFSDVTSSQFKNAMRAEVQSLKASKPPQIIAHTFDLLSFFFPNVQVAFDDAETAGHRTQRFSNNEIVDRRGVGLDRIYDAYFQLYIPSGLIGRAALATFFAHTNDEERTYAALKRGDLQEKGNGEHWDTILIEAITARVEVLPRTASVPLLRTALRMLCEMIERAKGESGGNRPEMAWQLLKGIAAHLSVEQIRAGFDKPGEGVSLHALLLVADALIGEDVRRKPDFPWRRAMIASVRDHIQRAAIEDRLHTTPALELALEIWMTDKTPPAPKQWIDDHINEQWLLPSLEAFLQSRNGVIIDAYGHYRMEEAIQEIFDIPRLRVVIDNYLSQNRPDDNGVFKKMQASLQQVGNKKARG